VKPKFQIENYRNLKRACQHSINSITPAIPKQCCQHSPQHSTILFME
jgi:hypothetical protein